MPSSEYDVYFDLQQQVLSKHKLTEDALIDESVTFIDWCEDLAAKGLKVDGIPFSLDDRPALRYLYEIIPTSIEEARHKLLIVMKGAQLGLTVWEMLVFLYFSLKFSPCKLGSYVPDRSLAAYKSSERFLPIIRTVPDAYQKLLKSPSDNKKTSEGNVLTRNIGASKVLFLWTSGKVSTESYPLDVLGFDEVQGMLVSQMETVMERLSASEVGYVMMLSTAKWPDADIHYWYQRGNQMQFHTKCDCEGGVVLDEHFPDCIQYNASEIGGAPENKYIYVCPVCKVYIENAQVGEWKAKVKEKIFILDDVEVVSIHMPQFLSATVTPGAIISSYNTATDMQNFYNRKLGKPYADPSQIPISLDIMNRCAKDGMEAGVVWEKSGKGYYMGIDQMGQFNVVIIKKRLEDGRQAAVHVEAIYSDDPFVRCDELMRLYGVAICIVESLPNYNDAKRFAGRFVGRVFLVSSYGDISDDMIKWGDTRFGKADRKTDEEERDRYTVRLDQYKCMQTSMARFVNRHCVFPDAKSLTQEVVEKGIRKTITICRDMVFLHFTKTALVVERDEEQKKFRRKVVKVGIDPHFSYANMLCDVAWARAHGTTQFILPVGDKVDDEKMSTETVEEAMPGLPKDVVSAISQRERNTCGSCESYDPEVGRCNARSFSVKARDPACMMHVEAEDF